jgi:hypothetical protein
VGDRADRALLPSARVVLPPDPVRQAGHGALGPRPSRRPPHARDPDGRHAGRHGQGGRGAGRGARPLRRRSDVRALRGHVSGAHGGARHGGERGADEVGARLPARSDGRGRRGAGAVDSRRLGNRRRSLVAPADGAVDRRRRGAGAGAHARRSSRREPRRGCGADADERDDRHPARAAGDSRPDACAASLRRGARGGQPLRGRADPGARESSSCPAATTCRGSATRMPPSTRSRSS